MSKMEFSSFNHPALSRHNFFSVLFAFVLPPRLHWNDFWQNASTCESVRPPSQVCVHKLAFTSLRWYLKPFGLGSRLISFSFSFPTAKVDLDNELVRHFLIETTKKGVRLKGVNDEPVFGEFNGTDCWNFFHLLLVPHTPVFMYCTYCAFLFLSHLRSVLDRLATPRIWRFSQSLSGDQ